MAPPVAPKFLPADRLKLDWRELPSGSNILGRLQKLLTTIDSTGELHMELTMSKAKNIISSVEIEVGRKAIVRFSKLTAERFETNKLYFAKLTLIIEYLVQHIGSRQQVKFRQAYYANVLSLTQAQLRKTMSDIALTVGLHPASLGVESECDGRIYIPEGIKIVVFHAQNLYEVAQARDAKLTLTGDTNAAKKAAIRSCAKMTLASEQTIPSKVMDIRITKGTVSIVIVVEHRNIGTRLDAIRESLANALIILTQGYSTHATREFLNMLESLLRNTPFVFFSDHDTQAAQIFANLKYGSILSSYATDILRCPRLEWGGPTQKQLLQHLEATHTDADTPWSSRLPKLLERMTMRPKRSDHSIIRNLERMGLHEKF